MNGPLNIHWNKITNGERGVNLADFCDIVSALPSDQMWRHNQAGDLAGDGDTIDREALLELARANAGRPVICYTHKPLNKPNIEAIREARELGFNIVISTQSPEQAHYYGFPAATVLPSSMAKDENETEAAYRARVGRETIVCPATYRDDVSCASCGLCARLHPGTTIGFPVHGAGKKKAEAEL